MAFFVKFAALVAFVAVSVQGDLLPGAPGTIQYEAAKFKQYQLPSYDLNQNIPQFSQYLNQNNFAQYLTPNMIPRDFSQYINYNNIPQDFSQYLNYNNIPKDFSQYLNYNNIPQDFSQYINLNNIPREFPTYIKNQIPNEMPPYTKNNIAQDFLNKPIDLSSIPKNFGPLMQIPKFEMNLPALQLPEPTATPKQTTTSEQPKPKGSEGEKVCPEPKMCRRDAAQWCAMRTDGTEEYFAHDCPYRKQAECYPERYTGQRRPVSSADECQTRPVRRCGNE